MKGVQLSEEEPIEETKKERKEEETTMKEEGLGAEKVGLEYVNFMRNSFRTWMENVSLMQDQGERLLNLTLKQGETGYEEGKKTFGEWTANYKKASEQFKSSVEENLAKLEEFLSQK